MGAFQNYPYADVHQLNLDWIIKEVKEVKDRTDEIDQAVTDSKAYAETAQESAENASQSKDDAVTASTSAQNFYNQILYLTGTAVVANQASDMSDTSKTYIYVGSEAGYETNHWYYYDGNEWVDGGLYGAGSGMSDNSRNLLRYILERVAYTEPDMNTYINALYESLADPNYSPSTFTVTNALTHVINSNSASGVNLGSGYSATLTAESGYVLDQVTVTMGGVDVTSSVYSGGVINITSVTGDIVITASAIATTVISLEDGSLDSNGLNDNTTYWQNRRVRSSSYVAVSPNTSYTVTLTTVKDVSLGVSYYNVDDFNTARIGSSGWQTSPYTFTTNSNTRYLRLLIGSNPTSSNTTSNTISASDFVATLTEN